MKKDFLDIKINFYSDRLNVSSTKKLCLQNSYQTRHALQLGKVMIIELYNAIPFEGNRIRGYLSFCVQKCIVRLSFKRFTTSQ